MKFAIAARSSGLGDMLNQLVHVRWFCKETSRKCLVDWVGNKYFASTGSSHADVFQYVFESDTITSVSEVQYELDPSSSYTIIKKAVDSDMLPVVRELLEPSILENYAVAGIDPSQENIRVVKPVKFLPIDAVRSIYKEIRPRKYIVDQVDELLAEGNDYIGIHIRHGNGELYDHSSELELLESYKAGIEKVVACAEFEPKYFLATDSELVERWFSEEFGHFYKSSKYMPESGRTLHHADSTRGTGISRDQVLVETVVDMLALSRCRTLICDSWSSFTLASQAWGDFSVANGNLHTISVPRKPRTARLKTPSTV